MRSKQLIGRLLAVLAVAMLAVTACNDVGNRDDNAVYNLVCDNGVAAIGLTTIKDHIQCVSCNSGYYLDADTNRCLEGIAFVCANGSAAAGEAPANDTTKCIDCVVGHSLIGDRCIDDDLDGDYVTNNNDSCYDTSLTAPIDAVWLSTSYTDHDSDGCFDFGEDDDVDNDGVVDVVNGAINDLCPHSAIGFVSNAETDADGNGCADSELPLDVGFFADFYNRADTIGSYSVVEQYLDSATRVVTENIAACLLSADYCMDAPVFIQRVDSLLSSVSFDSASTGNGVQLLVIDLADHGDRVSATAFTTAPGATVRYVDSTVLLPQFEPYVDYIPTVARYMTDADATPAETYPIYRHGNEREAFSKVTASKHFDSAAVKSWVGESANNNLVHEAVLVKLLNQQSGVVSMSYGGTNQQKWQLLAEYVASNNAQDNLWVTSLGRTGTKIWEFENQPDALNKFILVGEARLDNDDECCTFHTQDCFAGEATYPDFYNHSDIMVWVKNGEQITTSHATPIVSGVAARLRQKYPNASAETIRAVILGTADTVTDTRPIDQIRAYPPDASCPPVRDGDELQLPDIQWEHKVANIVTTTEFKVLNIDAAFSDAGKAIVDAAASD